MASREKDQADFDLEHFIDMFDEALSSKDERVVNALRQLMMMVILTKPEGRKDPAIGPLRRLFDDMNNINRRLGRLEDYQERARYHSEQKEVYKWPTQQDVWQTSCKDVWNATTYGQGRMSGLMQDFDIEQTIKTLNSPKGK